jgi:NAD(P)-dependent dehydrogenase (short-subunit alcohol dehydrogenase family)
MALFRAEPNEGIAWVTGASSGIGRALALDLARLGYTVAATARSEDRLAALEAESVALPGRIVAFPADVTEEAEMDHTVAAIENRLGPIALAIFNAGNFYPTRGERLQTTNFVRTYSINLFGVVYGLVPVVEKMRERRRGHLVIVGSASSFFGWPSAAAYGSSKAALNSLAESLKFDLDKLNIRVQVVNPGFVDTPLTEKNSFPMPFLLPVDKAAARIVASVRTGGFETSFPRRLTIPLKFLSILPQPLRYMLVNRLTGWKNRSLSSAKRPADLTDARR